MRKFKQDAKQKQSRVVGEDGIAMEGEVWIAMWEEEAPGPKKTWL